MKIIGIKDMVNGNETVGSMWKETKIFKHDTPLVEVMQWAGLKTNVTLSIPENFLEDFTKNHMDVF